MSFSSRDLKKRVVQKGPSIFNSFTVLCLQICLQQMLYAERFSPFRHREHKKRKEIALHLNQKEWLPSHTAIWFTFLFFTIFLTFRLWKARKLARKDVRQNNRLRNNICEYNAHTGRRKIMHVVIATNIIWSFGCKSGWTWHIQQAI